MYLSLAVKESFFWTIIRSTYHQLQAIGEPLKGYTTGWQLLFEEELQPWDFANVFFFRVTMTCPYLSLRLPFCRRRMTKDGTKRDVKTAAKSSQKTTVPAVVQMRALFLLAGKWYFMY